MAARHVIVGAGPVGQQTAKLLVAEGHEVRVVTRSGTSDPAPGAERVAADAADAERLTELTSGASVLYNCAGPAYHRWATDWPPLAAALITAAERSGAVLASVSNLYAYGRVTAPMTESTLFNPHGVKGRVRAAMSENLFAAHRAGRMRATEVRAADFIGRGVGQLGERVVPKILAGRGVQVLSAIDQPHTWSFVDDVARMLVVAGSDERAWGRPWHVPSGEPRSQEQVVNDLAAAAGVGPIKTSVVPGLILRAMGLFNPTIRELAEVSYQLESPFIMDSSAAQQMFALTPTPWAEVLQATLAPFRPTA